MTERVALIENFNHNQIVTLNQNVSAKRYLILDLWENIGKICGNDDNDNFKQIFLQINDLCVSRIVNDRIYLDVTDRNDIIDPLIAIEDSVILILRDYLAKIHKKGKFNFCSIMKEETETNTNNKQKKSFIVLNLTNPDYDPGIFNYEKNKSSHQILRNKNSTFNVIAEFMNINFDMKEGTIIIDTRLRLVCENKISPQRVKLFDVNHFIETPRQRVTEIQNHENHHASIIHNFDLTQTEIFSDNGSEDEDESKHESKHESKSESKYYDDNDERKTNHIDHEEPDHGKPDHKEPDHKNSESNVGVGSELGSKPETLNDMRSNLDPESESEHNNYPDVILLDPNDSESNDNVDDSCSDNGNDSDDELLMAFNDSVFANQVFADPDPETMMRFDDEKIRHNDSDTSSTDSQSVIRLSDDDSDE
jgi:hypothetical protein